MKTTLHIHTQNYIHPIICYIIAQFSMKYDAGFGITQDPK